MELLGLRKLMVSRDLKRIDEYERVWRQVHGEPLISDFVRKTAVDWSRQRQFHTSPTRIVGLSAKQPS
jgi:hypothetical protein